MTERWASFDCYGTLVDWKAGMSAALRSVGVNDVNAVLAAYHRAEPDVQAEGFAKYREVMARALARALRATGVSARPGAADVFGDTLPAWPVFDDVVSRRTSSK
jgi:2-haloacid dehalogenase